LPDMEATASKKRAVGAAPLQLVDAKIDSVWRSIAFWATTE